MAYGFRVQIAGQDVGPFLEELPKGAADWVQRLKLTTLTALPSP